MEEIRCKGILKNGRRCNKLLGKVEEGATYEIQCPNSQCKTMNTNKESVE